MSQVKSIALVGWLVAVASLLIPFFVGGRWQWAALALLVGLAGGAGIARNVGWANDLFLGGVVTLAAVGVLIPLSPFPMLLALLGALASWDLNRFRLRAPEAPSSPDWELMKTRHLRALLVALLLGGALSTLALVLRLRLGFGLTLFLALLLVVGLVWAWGWLRGLGE